MHRIKELRSPHHQGISPPRNELATNELATKLSQLATKIQYKVDYELKLAVRYYKLMLAALATTITLFRSPVIEM